MVQLLESIDSKLDRLDDIVGLLDTIKMDVSGFEHDGKTFPGSSDQIVDAVNSVQSQLESIQSSLTMIELNTSS